MTSSLGFYSLYHGQDFVNPNSYSVYLLKSSILYLAFIIGGDGQKTLNVGYEESGREQDKRGYCKKGKVDEILHSRFFRLYKQVIHRTRRSCYEPWINHELFYSQFTIDLVTHLKVDINRSVDF